MLLPDNEARTTWAWMAGFNGNGHEDRDPSELLRGALNARETSVPSETAYVRKNTDQEALTRHWTAIILCQETYFWRYYGRNLISL